jgi:hypothetical protein
MMKGYKKGKDSKKKTMKEMMMAGLKNVDLTKRTKSKPMTSITVDIFKKQK